jgi:hypothetical protein
MLAVFPIGNEIARQFLDRFHERLARWRRLIDREVVGVVAVQWRRTKDGRMWASRRLVGLYEARNGEAM